MKDYGHFMAIGLSDEGIDLIEKNIEEPKVEKSIDEPKIESKPEKPIVKEEQKTTPDNNRIQSSSFKERLQRNINKASESSSRVKKSLF